VHVKEYKALQELGFEIADATIHEFSKMMFFPHPAEFPYAKELGHLWDEDFTTAADTRNELKNAEIDEANANDDVDFSLTYENADWDLTIEKFDLIAVYNSVTTDTQMRVYRFFQQYEFGAPGRLTAHPDHIIIDDELYIVDHKDGTIPDIWIGAENAVMDIQGYEFMHNDQKARKKSGESRKDIFKI
jgi:hypothetical protein